MKRLPAPPNPWKLSTTECAVLDAVLIHGTPGKVAAALHRSIKTISTHLARATFKIAGDDQPWLFAVIAWNNFKRGELVMVGWMNPRESFAPNAFLWTADERNHPEYSVPVYKITTP